MKIHQSNPSKLFFGKWFYRIECVQDGASRIKHAGADRVEQWCLSSVPTSPWERKIDNQALYNFLLAVKPFLKNKNLQIRVEGSHFNLYCNELELVEKINKALSKWIRRITGPTSQEEINFLLTNSNKKVLCKKLPKNRYKYKLFLNYNISDDRRLKFYQWASNYGEQIYFTESASKWLLGETLWWSTVPYMYVENDKTLSMVGLYLGSDVRKIQEHILRGSVLRE